MITLEFSACDLQSDYLRRFFFFFFLNNCYAENFNLFELYKVYVTFNSCFVFQSFSSGSVAKWQNLGTSFPRILIVGSHLN